MGRPRADEGKRSPATSPAGVRGRPGGDGGGHSSDGCVGDGGHGGSGDILDNDVDWA